MGNMTIADARSCDYTGDKEAAVMINLHKHFLKWTSVFVATAIIAIPAWADEWQFEGVSRIVAIADIHGAYGPMVEALQSAGVIDDELAWSAADSHLVIVGDILDRGPESRKAMDLLMRLETEANEAAGRVHVLIGNHEAMNLVGDLRYVSTAEYAAFADDELPDDRERWFAAYAKHRASAEQSPEAVRTVFDQRYPVGFFAHRRAFGSKGKYGKWLLSKPAVVVVNQTAFVHGGLSPMIEEIGLKGVNGTLVGEMADYVRKLETLYSGEALLPTDSFHDHPGILSDFKQPLRGSPDLSKTIKAIGRLNDSDLHSLQGPLWYRGNVVCSELIEVDKLVGSLRAIDATRVVIGHTPTPGRRVLERLDGQIIEIDTGMLNNYYGGSANVLVIDQDGVSVINQRDEEVRVPKPHPRHVGSRPGPTLTAKQIEELLAGGEMITRSSDQSGRDIVTVSDGTNTIESVFAKRSGRDFYPNVAAYRLDRLLNLDMVPVTVRRELDGVDGSLRFNPKNWIDEIERQEKGSGGSAWCPLPEQWNAMTVFDVLVYNEGRQGANILYSLDFWQLMLVAYGDAFSTRKGVPARLKNVPYDVGQGWKDALSSLTEDALQQSLGDVIGEKRVRALIARAEALAEAD